MPSAQELVAHGRTEEEVCTLIGADWLVYQDLEDLISCSREGNPEIERFDCSLFNGEYVTGDVDASYLSRLHAQRNNLTREYNDAVAHSGDSALVGLHNNVN
jgi:amidophosphoribosyltransferase